MSLGRHTQIGTTKPMGHCDTLHSQLVECLLLCLIPDRAVVTPTISDPLDRKIPTPAEQQGNLQRTPWSVETSNRSLKHLGRQDSCSFANLNGSQGVRGFGLGDSFRAQFQEIDMV